MKSWRAPLTVTYLLLFAAAWLLYLPAEARMHHPYRGHRIIPGTAAPLDGFTQPAAAYSLRKLKSTYSGPAARLIRAIDSAQQDINFLGFVPGLGAPFDIAAANAFCASTTCKVHDWYDQSGNGRHVGTNPYSPDLIFNCLGTQPCLRSIDGSMIGGPTVTPAAVGAYSAVGKSGDSPAGPGTCSFIQPGGQSFGSNAGSPIWLVYQPGGTISAPAAHGSWHAGSASVNGASSAVNIDGVETPGSMTGGGGANWIYVAATGTTGIPCYTVEVVWWDNYALTPAERAALRANQKSFWGTP